MDELALETIQMRMAAPLTTAGTSRRVLFASANGLRVVESVYPAGANLSPHAHDFGNVSLVLTGSLVEESDRGAIRAGPGCAVIKPAATWHCNAIGPHGARMLALELEVGASTHDVFRDHYLWCSHMDVLRSMLHLYAIALGGHHLASGVLERLFVAPGLAGFQITPPWLASVQESIHAGGSGPMTVGALARDVGAHPVYLARVFRRCLGSAPTEYLHRLRITQAAHSLACTDIPLIEVALDNGFSDQAHFCRQFRTHVGMTPGAYRRLSRNP